MEQKINVVLDATMTDLFQLCEERFRLRFIKNKTTPIKSIYLDRGTIVHLALEEYYKLLAQGIAFHDRVSFALNVSRREIAAGGTDPYDEKINRIPEVLEEYLHYWRKVDEGLGIISVETPFSYILHEDAEIRIIMAGKIDLMVNDLPNYSNLPIDHKTYDSTRQDRRLNNQFANYANACSSNYLMVNKIGFQTSLKAEQKFKRVPLSYDPFIVEQWKQDTIKTVHRYLDCLATDSWQRNLTSCDKFNRLCEFYEVCNSSGQEAKDYRLEMDFRDAEPWDVGNTLGRKKEMT